MYVGIDIGGMSIKAGIVTPDGKLLGKSAVQTPRGGNDEIFRAVYEAILGAQEKTGVHTSEIEAIGAGAPGVVDRERGVLVYGCNLSYKSADLRAYLGKHFDVPVIIENDANCAALGEFYASDVNNLILITIGTGIGGGVIMNRKLFIGSNGAAGELGHIVTHARGRKCLCGREGCWEAYASVTGLVHITEEHRSEMPSVAGGGRISGRTAFEEAKRGNAAAVAVRDEWIEEVAVGIVNVINSFQPEELVIGGAISREGDVLLKPIREYAAKYEYTHDQTDVPKTKIIASRLGGDAGIIGAALLWKNKNE